MSTKGAYGDSRPEDTGRNAYREPGEPPDDRRCVIDRRPFWKNSSEELAWLFAVEQARPFRKSDTLTEHLERIAKIAGAELGGKPAKDFPETRLPYPDDSE